MNADVAHERKRRSGRAMLAGLAACAAVVALPASSALASGGGVDTGGGPDTVAGSKAKLKPNGKAVAPANAPQAVKDAIAAANKIDDKGYRLGGGHGSWNDNAYDCSGAVSYTLGPKGADVINSPMVSGDFARWASGGKGDWITTYGDSDHVFIVIAGLRFDTSQPDDGDKGPGWSKDVGKGFANVSKKAARHKGSL